MDANLKTRSQAVKAWRVEAGMSQEELVAELSYDRTMVSGWENGRYAVSNDTLLRIARITGRSISDVEAVLISELEAQASSMGGWGEPSDGAPHVRIWDYVNESHADDLTLASEREQWARRTATTMASSLGKVGVHVDASRTTVCLNHYEADFRFVADAVDNSFRYLHTYEQERVVLDVMGDDSISASCWNVMKIPVPESWEAWPLDEITVRMAIPIQFTNRADLPWGRPWISSFSHRNTSTAAAHEMHELACYGYFNPDKDRLTPTSATIGFDKSNGQRILCDFRKDGHLLVVSQDVGRIVGNMIGSVMAHAAPDSIRLACIGNWSRYNQEGIEVSPFNPYGATRQLDDELALLAYLVIEGKRRMLMLESAGIDQCNADVAGNLTGGKPFPHLIVAIPRYDRLAYRAGTRVEDLVRELCGIDGRAGISVVAGIGPGEAAAGGAPRLDMFESCVVSRNNSHELSVKLLGGHDATRLADAGPSSVIVSLKSNKGGILRDASLGGDPWSPGERAFRQMAQPFVDVAADGGYIGEHEVSFAFKDEDSGMWAIDYKSAVTDSDFARSAGLGGPPCKWAAGLSPADFPDGNPPDWRAVLR